MAGFVVNLEDITISNSDFRRVLYTTKYSQLVVMSLAPGEDIGEEIHDLDQFIRVESGQGLAIMNDIEYALEDGSAVVIPAGVKHNIVNQGHESLKLYTLYSPPEHKDGVVRRTKKEALDNEEHFDGQTTED